MWWCCNGVVSVNFSLLRMILQFLVDEYVLGHDDASLDLYKSLFLMEEDLLILQNAFGHM